MIPNAMMELYLKQVVKSSATGGFDLSLSIGFC